MLFCGHTESKVIDSRPTDEGASIRRRRECLACGKRFTTYETIETVSVMVVKKDKSREAFDREKLLKGLLRACEKRPVPVKQLENLVDEVESTVLNMLEREVTSEAIGEMVMERLKKIDDIAYIRFASVYRQFRDIDSLNEEVSKLIQREKGLMLKNGKPPFCTAGSNDMTQQIKSPGNGCAARALFLILCCNHSLMHEAKS